MFGTIQQEMLDVINSTRDTEDRGRRKAEQQKVEGNVKKKKRKSNEVGQLSIHVSEPKCPLCILLEMKETTHFCLSFILPVLNILIIVMCSFANVSFSDVQYSRLVLNVRCVYL